MMDVDDTILADLLAQAEAAEENVVAVLAAETQPDMDFLVDRVKANVPLQTGNLAAHVSVVSAQSETGIEYTFVANTGYALLVHERPPVEGREDPDGSEPEGGRGRKYLSRVMEFHEQRIRNAYQRAQRRLTGGD